MSSKQLKVVCLLCLAFGGGLALAACGKPSPGSPEAAAEAAFEIWTQQTGIPYKDVRYDVVSNDGTFATVRIIGQFRESVEAPWTEEQANVECRKVGRDWQCDEWMSFSLTEEETQRFVNETIAQLSRLTSYRARGEGLVPSGGQTLRVTVIEEWKAPDEIHRVLQLEDGRESELIGIGDSAYHRAIDGVWRVYHRAESGDHWERWTNVMTGKPAFPEGEVKESSTYIDASGETICRVYRMIEATPQYGEWTFVLWIDINTHLPIKSLATTTAEEGVGFSRLELEYQEFNVPVIITVPDVNSGRE